MTRVCTFLYQIVVRKIDQRYLKFGPVITETSAYFNGLAGDVIEVTSAESAFPLLLILVSFIWPINVMIYSVLAKKYSPRSIRANLNIITTLSHSA